MHVHDQDLTTGFSARFYSFAEQPNSDSCWSLQTGPDGRIYAASCIEHTPGETVTVLRYNEAEDRLDSLFEMDRVTGDLRDSGRATQCKIHYSFAPSPATGLLYAATHLSGPPKGERRYNPWASWHDPKRAFRGAYLAAFDTAADSVAVNTPNRIPPRMIAGAPNASRARRKVSPNREIEKDWVAP